MQHIARARRRPGLVCVEQMELRGSPRLDVRVEPRDARWRPQALAGADARSQTKRYVDSDELADIVAALACAHELPRAS